MPMIMNEIFRIVYSALMFISEITGLSYNEVNIIAYYIVLPFIYVALADKIWGKHLLKITYVCVVSLVLLLIPNFRIFSDRLFDDSVRFLLSFEMFGWNYVVSSVMICVVFPGIVFLVMLHFAYPRILQVIRSVFPERTEFIIDPPSK